MGLDCHSKDECPSKLCPSSRYIDMLIYDMCNHNHMFQLIHSSIYNSDTFMVGKI